MKLTIRFKHNESDVYPCAAFVDTETQPNLACVVAKTWAEARGAGVGRPGVSPKWRTDDWYDERHAYTYGEYETEAERNL